MKTIFTIALLMSGSLFAADMQITNADSVKASEGPASNFTGKVEVRPLTSVQDPSRVSSALVTFQKGARSNWHTHPLGQTLIVKEGMGYVQQEGQKVQTIKKGDVIWTPPGVKHWHGATRDSILSHYAVQEMLTGKAVEWLDKVTDEQYPK
jgi:quercetin dioxygenase-like cupin family protein